MPLPTTFRGQSIVAFPCEPGIRQLQIDLNDTVAVTPSPFTQATDTQLWPGADFWTASLTLPQLTIEQAATWSAFLGSCRGMSGVFFLGHPLYRSPRGTAAGQPVVNGTNAPMTTVLSTRGWTPSSFGVLKAGDMFQIGYRLHLVMADVASDAEGKATISIWPSIREAPADGDPVILANPQGLWRMASNKRSILATETRLSGVNFTLMEAR